MNKRILLIEDDLDIAELMRIYLSNEGYDVEIIADGLTAYEQWAKLQPSLILLDLKLPGIDGMELCRHIRSKSTIPIIIVTANGELNEKLHGFNLGADDYLVKPFDPLELVARVKAVLKRYGANNTEKKTVTTLPGLTIDLDSYTVKVEGEPVDLTKREVELLHFLAVNPGRVFTREYLLKELWGYEYSGGTRTVDVHINHLREKVVRPHLPWSINTLWGLGYKMEVY